MWGGLELRSRYGASGLPTALMVCAALAASGCDDQPGALPPDGRAIEDAAPVDAAPLDVGAPDAAPPSPDAAPPAPDADPIDATPPDAGPPSCDPPLAIEPAEVFTSAFDLTVFTPSGGTGGYRFALVDNGSEAIINALSGAYLAGGVEGTVDEVVLTDVGCAGEARATVYVADPLVIAPAIVEVAAGQTLRFAATGGAGSFEYSLPIEQSGGYISADGLYTAGDVLGRDVVRVRDPQTGLEDEAVVEIIEDPTLTVDRPRLYLPVGAQMPLAFTGGSGHLTAAIDGEAVRYDGESQIVTAVGAGTARIAFTDDFTGLEVAVDVEAAAALEAPFELRGEGAFFTELIGPGDLDGDGYADVVVGDFDHDVDAINDGAVRVYRGGPDGLDPAPAQVFVGARRTSRLGLGLAVADLDRDGVLDLIAGASEDDTVRSDGGLLYIHRGIDGGLFEPEPAAVLQALRNGDRFGRTVAACDFDGDGWLDLAVGAHLYEDPMADPVANNQGAVFIHLGGPDGFGAAPVDRVVGQALDETGAWVYTRDVQMPSALAAGDVDGDGRCDLVASSTRHDGNAGAVYVYRGRASSDEVPGGVEPLPARVYVGAGGSGNLGRRLAVADLDGDGRADIVASEHGYDGEDDVRDRGAVRIFAGGALDGPAAALTPADEAAWTVLGDNRGDNRGVSIAIGDVDGDGLPDVLTGAWHDEAEEDGATGDVGSAAVYPGRPGDWPATEPSIIHHGEVATALFGEAVAPVGDVDGDGLGDLMVSSGRSDEGGVDQIQPWFVPGGEGPRIAVDHVASPSGLRYGFALATTGDIDGDGLGDLLVGAHEAPLAPNQLRAGEAYLYPGVEGGYRATPTVVFEGHTGHSGTDRYGYGVASGDIDGDGLEDAIISALAEERPNSFDPELYAVDGECPTGRDQGAVYVYRGGATLDGARPDYIYYGPAQGAQAWRVRAADLNGDGLDDLLIGAPLWDIDGVGNDAGGVQIVYGRPPAPDGRVRVLCDPARTFAGTVAAGAWGRAIERLGDLDGDGCEDVAIGGDNEDIDPGAEGEIDRGGALRVLYGWNNAGCRRNPRMVTFVGTGNQARLGFSAAAGDLFGGPEPELAIGAINQQRGGNTRFGAVYVIDGARLAGLPTHAPDAADPLLERLDFESAAAFGEINGEQLGRRVQIHDRRLYVSRLFGAIGDATRLGGAEVYAFDAPDQPRRVASIAGETWRYESRIGEALRIDPTRGLLTIGGEFASGASPEAGAVYVFPLPPSE